MTFRRALFIRFGGFGDILLTTPAVRAVHRAFPGIEIDYIVGANMAESLEGHPLVRRIITFDKCGDDARPTRFLAFLRGLAERGYDLVVNLHPSAKSYAMRLATGAATAVTFRKCMDVNPETGRVAHAVDDFLKELTQLGAVSDGNHGLDFPIPESAYASMDRILREERIDGDTLLLVINPAASRPINRWPSERFAAIAARFAEQRNVAVCVTGASASFRTYQGGEPDEVVAARIAAADPRIRNFAGRLTLKEFGALLSRADVFLTCDTGPMQIGSALGTPMVVLSGAADPDRTGPLGPEADVLIDRALPCVPCRARTCVRRDLKCMDDLNVENVAAAIAFKLRQRQRAARGIAIV
jgi:ADP-heptose:LPS heptosyltransferase